MKRIKVLLIILAAISLCSCTATRRGIVKSKPAAEKTVGVLAAGGMIFWISSFSRSFPNNNNTK